MIPEAMTDNFLGHWPYVAIFTAAAIEGEVVYIGACVLAGMGHLSMLGVWMAGALGGSVGDQVFYYATRYATRSRLANWLLPDSSGGGIPTAGLIRWIRNRAGAMIMASRFLPGLRIAIPVCAAYANVEPLRFSLLSISSGILWAGGVLSFVTVLGPRMGDLGIPTSWAMALTGATLLIVVLSARKFLVRHAEDNDSQA